MRRIHSAVYRAISASAQRPCACALALMAPYTAYGQGSSHRVFLRGLPQPSDGPRPIWSLPALRDPDLAPRGSCKTLT
eukprot:1209424-Rhodomonas_salina.1